MKTRTPPPEFSNLQQNEASTIDNNSTHCRQNKKKKVMEKFREVILKLAETCPNAPSNPGHKTLLQDRLNQFFSEYKTPDHPPYSAMIERALSELNEKKGSTGDQISQFIIKEYDALPWAHLTLLEHHLEILCKSGDIVETRSKRYMLAGENTRPQSSTKGRKKRRKRKYRWAWERDINKKRRKRNQPTGNRVELIEEHKESDEKLIENVVNSEEKQNEGMMAVDEMEHSMDMPQEREIDPSEIISGHICGAGKEEKQEEGKGNKNQLEQSIVVAEREFLDLPISVPKLDSPRDPSVHDFSKSENFLEFAELSDMKLPLEAHEMAGSVKEGNPQSVNVHETVSNTSLVSYKRCNNSKRTNEEAVPNVPVPRCQSGIIPASAEEFPASTPLEIQQRRCSIRSPKAMDFTGLDTSPQSHNHQLPWLKLSDVEMPQDQREESVSFIIPEQYLLHEKQRSELLEADVEIVQSVMIECKPKETKVYRRRRKTRHEQLQKTVQLVPMKSDVNLFKSNAIVDSQISFVNEHEAQELLQQPPLLQGQILQNKPSHDEDANLITVLQPEHQPEECQKTVLKRRGRPPKHKPVTGTCKISSPSLYQVLQGEILQNKPSHDEDANLIAVLQPEHQPEECQKTVLKRRGRPPKHIPVTGTCKISSTSLCQEMIDPHQHEEPPKRQTRQRQCKEKANVRVRECKINSQSKGGGNQN